MNPHDPSGIEAINEGRDEERDEERDDDVVSAAIALREKLIDALTPGFHAEFDPDEADMAGAFFEDALSEQDAADSSVDLDLDIEPNVDLMVVTLPVAANDRE